MKFEFSLKSKEMTMFLRSLYDNNLLEQNYTCHVWTSRCFLVHHCPTFSSCLQTQSTLFISIPSSCLVRLEEGEDGKMMRSCLSSFYVKQNIYHIFNPQCQTEDGIKKGVRRERWNMKFFQTHPSIHLIQHVLNACHFSDALWGTGYIHFLPTIFQVRTQTASVWNQKLLGKEKASSAEWSHCTFTIKWDSRPDKNINFGGKLGNISKINNSARKLQAHFYSKNSRFRWNQLKLWTHTQYSLHPILHNSDLFTESILLTPTHTGNSCKLSECPMIQHSNLHPWWFIWTSCSSRWTVPRAELGAQKM